MRQQSLTVALVGADGAGKSTVAQQLVHADLPRPASVLYMGVNLEASTLMLPTTRLLLAAKRRRGGRPDLVGSSARQEPSSSTSARARGRRSGRDFARFAVWSTEEWLRLVVANVLRAQGRIVILDRHFVADYWYADAVAKPGSTRGLASRIHGWVLRNLYPRPDLMICLDAPATVLYARKPEASVDALECRRREYLFLDHLAASYHIIDASRPLDAVVAEVAHVIAAEWKAKSS